MTSLEADTKHGNIISGLEAAESLHTDIKKEIEIIKKCKNSYITSFPRLDVVIVGDRQDSITYVRNKGIACEKVGILQQCHSFPSDITQVDLENAIEKLNNDATVTAILIQLPLPNHLDSEAVVDRISPYKDADGLTTTNLGLLMRKGMSCASLLLYCLEIVP